MGVVKVWLGDPPPLGKADFSEVVHAVSRQSLAVDMARGAGLEVVYGEGENGGGVLVGVLGEPRKMARFLRDLAGHGIGGLTVDLEALTPEELALVKRAASDATRQLAFELVEI